MAKKYEVNSTIRRINKLTLFLARRGWGRQVMLTTTGRRSGQPREVPLSPITVDGVEFLVAPYGEVAWVRNVRANPEVTIRKGRETRLASLSEVTGEVPDVLKEYWDREAFAHQYMDVPDSPTIDDFDASGKSFPVFRVVSA
jgi:deazaflavin-dependent oxidoreductase (nitroreductase family)